MATAMLSEAAKGNFGRSFKCPNVARQGSIAGVLRWASWAAGDDSVFRDPGHFLKTRPKRVVEELRKHKKAQNQIDDDE